MKERLTISIRGFSLIELMIATMILTILIMAAVKINSSMSNASREVSMAKAEDRNIANILETVIHQFSQQQIAFTTVGLENADPKLDVLPLAWNEKVLVPEAQCPSCAGRMGLVARPHPSLPGVFVVSVRMTNSELFEGARNFKFLSVYK